MDQEIIEPEVVINLNPPEPQGAGIEYARSLRLIADFYEKHPEVPLPDLEIKCHSITGRAEVIKTAHALKTFDKLYCENFFTLSKTFGMLKLQFVEYRANVCKKKVVGTQVVKKKVPQTYVEVEEVVEKVEWECASSPLLSTMKELE